MHIVIGCDIVHGDQTMRGHIQASAVIPVEHVGSADRDRRGRTGGGIIQADPKSIGTTDGISRCGNIA